MLVLLSETGFSVFSGLCVWCLVFAGAKTGWCEGWLRVLWCLVFVDAKKTSLVCLVGHGVGVWFLLPQKS